MLEEVLSSKPVIEKKFFSGVEGQGVSVEKTIIKSKIYDPMARQVLQYEFNIGKVNTYQMRSKTTEGAPYPIALKNELDKYCPDINKQKAYFFNRVTDERGEEMPLFNGILYLGDGCPIEYINGKNRFDFMEAVTREMKDMVYYNYIHQSFAMDYFYLLHYLGDEINEYLYYVDKPEQYIEEVDRGEEDDDEYAGVFNYNLARVIEFENEVSKKEDLALKYYFLAAIESFYKYLADNKLAIRCNKCGKFASYRKGKKYCSSTCLKAEANKRHYKNKCIAE